MTDEGECSGVCNDSDTTSSLLPELQTGLGEGKALYHKKEYDAAIHTIEEVLGSSNNKRLLSEVCVIVIPLSCHQWNGVFPYLCPEP